MQYAQNIESNDREYYQIISTVHTYTHKHTQNEYVNHFQQLWIRIKKLEIESIFVFTLQQMSLFLISGRTSHRARNKTKIKNDPAQML